MGSILKLVYDNWINGQPLPNGRLGVVNDLIKKKSNVNILNSLEALPIIGSDVFDHSNFYLYFSRYYPANVVSPDNVNNSSLFMYPIEIRTTIELIYNENLTIVDNIRHKYNILDTVSPLSLSLIRAGKLKLLINLVHDPLEYREIIHNISTYFKKNKIDPANVIILLGNDFEREYKKYYPNDGIKLLYSRNLMLQQAAENAARYPYQSNLGYTSDIYRESDLNKNIKRNKRFLSFNRTMRDHRFALLYFMFKHDMLKHNSVSFLNDLGKNDSDITEILKYYFNDTNLNFYGKHLKNLIPIQIDTTNLSNNQRQSFNSDNSLKELYQDTYISIVTETSFSEYENIFVSEKIWKPIANLQPFLLLGNHRTLEYLKNLGFKTFHPFIDESYDNEIDPKLRIKMIFNEITKLNSLSIDEIHDWYYSITDILLHNQKLFMSFKDIDPFETVYQQIEKAFNGTKR
jgi:hypothetical protein